MSITKSKTGVLPRQGDSLKGLSYTNYDYHISGQIARSTIYSSGAAGNQPVRRTDYEWDGLALIKRGSTNLTNEPAATGGNAILADNKVLFNDMLGTTLGVVDSGKINSIKRDAFGQTFANSADNKYNMFTGKPEVKGLGYAFLFRNYRANLGKWQTVDPLGYPDGWNNLAYGNNQVTSSVDALGLCTVNFLGGWERCGTKNSNYIESTYQDYYSSPIESSCGDTAISESHSITFGLAYLVYSVGYSVSLTVSTRNLSDHKGIPCCGEDHTHTYTPASCLSKVRLHVRTRTQYTAIQYNCGLIDRISILDIEVVLKTVDTMVNHTDPKCE